MKLKILAVMLSVSFVLLTSCTPKVKIRLNDKNEVFVDMDIIHTDATRRLIKSLNSLGDSSMFDGKDENIENVKADNGVEIIHLKKTSALDVNAKFKFSDTAKLNSPMLSVNKEEKKMTFSLNRKTINAFFEQMSEEDREYLDLLMAPSLQNTKMSESEYVDLIANAYGNKASQELKVSRLSLIFEVPKKIRSVQLTPQSQHKVDDNRLEVRLALTKILVMNKEIEVVIHY